MTKEELLREFLSDPVALEKLNLTEGAVALIRFGDKTTDKLIATLKEAIECEFNRDTTLQISKRLQILLNQNDVLR
jgi:hypothetical protein